MLREMQTVVNSIRSAFPSRSKSSSSTAAPSISPTGRKAARESLSSFPFQIEPTMKTKRILVIDDEPSITRTMKVNLERAGVYSVCAENHANRALETARRFHPDLIFLDVMMPEIDGGHLAAQMKSHRELQSVPIVFLTAIVSPQETAVDGGMIAGHFFIAKPASLSELTKCIEEFTAA
jgi:two-component system, OmpR family, response regulator